MKNIFLILSRFLPEWILILCVLVSLNLLNNFSGSHQTVFFKSMGSVASSMYSVRNSVTQFFNLPQESKRLLDENTALRNLLMMYAEKPVNFSDTVSANKIYHPCQIVNSTINKSNNYFVINKGEAAGLKEGIAIVSDSALVGVVSSTSRSYSLVLPALNERFRAAAEIKDKGYFGILKWDAKYSTEMVLADVANYADIQVGDTLISRGGSVYPRDIPLGTVSFVDKIEGENYLDIRIRLFENYAKLRYVYWVEDYQRQELDSLIEESQVEL